MNKDSKIYVAGHRGLVGSALMRQLQTQGYHNIVTRTHSMLDLTNQQAVADFFKEETPDYVLLAAAKVGGIHANNTYPAEFIYKNLAIQTNVIHHSYINGVKRLLFLGSSCIYPKECPQPIKEEYLLTSELEPTNRPYALAKIAGIEMCWSYNRQYGTEYLALMPTNLYGPGDNYDLENSHVIPALIRKFHEAKLDNLSSVEIWGTGKPRREFLYSDDLAQACLHILKLDNKTVIKLLNHSFPPLINVGTNSDISIYDLAVLIKQVVNYNGEIKFDSTKPDGTMRKLTNIDRINGLGWKPSMSLVDGISRTYHSFVNEMQK